MRLIGRFDLSGSGPMNERVSRGALWRMRGRCFPGGRAGRLPATTPALRIPRRLLGGANG